MKCPIGHEDPSDETCEKCDYNNLEDCPLRAIWIYDSLRARAVKDSKC